MHRDTVLSKESEGIGNCRTTLWSLDATGGDLHERPGGAPALDLQQRAGRVPESRCTVWLSVGSSRWLPVIVRDGGEGGKPSMPAMPTEVMIYAPLKSMPDVNVQGTRQGTAQGDRVAWWLGGRVARGKFERWDTETMIELGIKRVSRVGPALVLAWEQSQ